ncbi:Rv3235 family protein [Arthrobacter sp. zg-Y820]|uniref:Rv3235 family protein n=1 Tax=unclassified Arthrobacter TaxID=235627 RepID=UPI001E2BF246|nr:MULTISPECIES: Rv3235 family protein [unclassified Arthrobacter]MCC9195987.1 Rv3235 family protein [Arthrobacter sp. zg-Y820]MDK1278846.1 Rv3235 family protein [Arthrobacter sp. zg.Y820]WIB08738.1 Rv3235 family protein [Arthrobacter sp. zg-Y820]
MTTVITFPVQEAADELATASGAPRPLTVHRIPVTGYSPAGAPPVKLRPRQPAPQAAKPADSSPATQDQAHWHSTPEDDARVNAIARSVTQAALEVLGGTRPLQQMARWLDPPSFERLQLRANLVRSRELGAAGGTGSRAGTGAAARQGTRTMPVRLHRQVVIRCCRICPVSEGIYEASVVAAEQSRVRAAALRIELRRGLWKVTALEIG